jgi:hypothetical protein
VVRYDLFQQPAEDNSAMSAKVPERTSQGTEFSGFFHGGLLQHCPDFKGIKTIR